MGRSQRDKGLRGQREAAAAVDAELGGPWHSNGIAAQATAPGKVADIESAEWSMLWVEVKRGKKIPVKGATEQVLADTAGSDRIPLLALRWDYGQWWLALPLGRVVEFARLLVSRLGRGR